VNGADLRAKVVGEGANLGLTQAGRIEFAAHGGRLNTDFIDNSAGVDTSDHEVNIKIALRAQPNAPASWTREGRDTLLASMTDEVASLVLSNNSAQTLVLSVAEARAAENLQGHVADGSAGILRPAGPTGGRAAVAARSGGAAGGWGAGSPGPSSRFCCPIPRCS
jgi:NAD-specific glutamate dehydrogenase